MMNFIGILRRLNCLLITHRPVSALTGALIASFVLIAPLSAQTYQGFGADTPAGASVAFDSGIINAQFYTTLVLTAVVTSQAAGAWLKLVLSRGWPLLSTNSAETWQAPDAKLCPELHDVQKNVA